MKRLVTIAMAAATLGACATEEIIVASEAPPLDGGRPVACASTAECGAEEVCRKTSCDAPSGECLRRPLLCTASPEPVCGCDGVTYFNDCLRLSRGVESASAGECVTGAARCGGPERTTCPAGAFCARLFPPGPACPRGDREAPGSCWALPADCGLEPHGGDRWRPCGVEGPCIDTCAAIRSELPHERPLRCAR